MVKRRVALVGSLSALALAGCSLAPAYRPPAIPAPVTFKEAKGWTVVNPAAAPVRVNWWKVYGDPVLDGLETQIESANPTLAQALGRYDAAQAQLRGARADLFPTIGLSGSVLTDRQSNHRPLRSASQPDFYGASTVEGGINYDLDLWGRVRNSVASARAESQASADDVAAVKLALETELATDYARLRGFDRQREVLAATVDSYAKADALVRRRFAGGIASGVDTGRSGAQLGEAQATLADIAAARAATEHAIASLVGVPASSFQVDAQQTTLPVPATPALLPSTLLTARPDIAAAERRMAEANADIGVARAAFFPSIGLGAQGGYQNTALAGLLAAPNIFWALGPTIAFNIFDGGRRHARVALARAQWEQATAAYRGKALTAFQQVEDDLAELRDLGDEQAAEDRAAQDAGQAETLSVNRYTKGAVTLLDVTTEQTAALRLRLNAIGVETRRVQASMRLAEALGGGWK